MLLFLLLLLLFDDNRCRLEKRCASGASKTRIIIVVERCELYTTQLALQTRGVERATLCLDITVASIDSTLATTALGVRRAFNMHKPTIAELQILTSKHFATHTATRHTVGTKSEIINDLVRAN